MGFFFEQKGKPSTKISSVPPFPNPQKKKKNTSVQRDNVWYDTKDWGRVRAAPTRDGVPVILPQAVGGNKTAVTATVATIRGWQGAASSCIQLIQKHLGWSVGEKTGV